MINRLGLLELAEISNMRHGWDSRLEGFIEAIGTSSYAQMAQNSLYIPCGALHLGVNDCVLDIKVEMGDAATLSCEDVMLQYGPDVRVSHHAFNTMQGVVKGCLELFLTKSSDVTAPSGESISLSLEAGGKSGLVGPMGIWAGSQVFGQIEASGPRRVARVYKCGDDIGETVAYNLTGTTTGYSFIAVTATRDSQAVSRGNIEMAGVMESRLVKMDESTRRAVERSQLSDSLEDIRQVKRLMNVK